MKKIFALCLSLIISSFLMSSQVLAEQGCILTTATSQAELVPDVVNFSVEIVTTSKDSMAKAIAENKQISAKVYENLKKATEKNTKDSLTTSNYSAVPIYKYNNNKKTLDYYQVTNNVKVRTHQLANLSQMIDKAMKDGATSITNLSFDVTNYDAECNKLLAQSSVKAKQQAQNIATALGTQILGIKSVDSSCTVSNKSVMPRMYMSTRTINMSADGIVEESKTNIEAGTMTLNVRVNISFYVK